MSQKDDWAKELKEQAEGLSQENLMRNARAVAMVQATVRHALVSLGENPDQLNVGLFMFGSSIHTMLQNGMTPEMIRDMVEANLAAAGVQERVSTDAAIKHMTKDQPEN